MPLKLPYPWKRLMSSMGVICLLITSSHAQDASPLAREILQIFRQQSWRQMNQWLGEKNRLYIRIPNLQTGFVTPDQAKELFLKMEKRFETKRFSVISDEGSEQNRWLIRARWVLYDRDLDDTFEYTIEFGWEYSGKRWRLVIMQAK